MCVGGIVAGFGADFERASSWEHFRASFKSALATPGVSVVEIPVDRDRSVAHHREIDRRVSEALASDGAGEALASDSAGEALPRDGAGEALASKIGSSQA